MEVARAATYEACDLRHSLGAQASARYRTGSKLLGGGGRRRALQSSAARIASGERAASGAQLLFGGSFLTSALARTL